MYKVYLWILGFDEEKSINQRAGRYPGKECNMLDTVRVTFDNGEVMTTDYNAAVGREGIAKYYMGNWFNLGVVSDDMHKVVKVEFPEA